jgi:Uma2 family endonuclease
LESKIGLVLQESAMVGIHSQMIGLPGSAHLPESDDTPVDNELQLLVPFLLRLILRQIWCDRSDWFFGINMGVYDRQGQMARTPIVADAFLSLGVEYTQQGQGRLSYVIAEEKGIVPQLVLELVSRTYGQEYEEKLATYARMGVLYYVIYNPHYWARDDHDPLEVYRLVDHVYVRQMREPVWMSEIGLGIGRAPGIWEGWQREWLYWYDSTGQRYPVREERMTQLQTEVTGLTQQLDQQRQRAERLAAYLRGQGIDPDQIGG